MTASECTKTWHKVQSLPSNDFKKFYNRLMQECKIREIRLIKQMQCDLSVGDKIASITIGKKHIPGVIVKFTTTKIVVDFNGNSYHMSPLLFHKYLKLNSANCTKE